MSDDRSPPPLPAVAEALAAFRARRSEESFRRLHRALAPRLYGLALRLVGASGDVEDALQEAWLRAVRDLDRFEGRSRFETWVGGIVVRCCLEQRRRAASSRRRFAPATAATDGTAGSRSAAAPTATPSARLDAEAVLRELPDGYRHVLVLHDLYGYTHAEIAGLLEIEEGTSKSQLARARRAARRALGGPATRPAAEQTS